MEKEKLSYTYTLADNSFQSLHLRVVPDDPNCWQSGQLIIIQKFFDSKEILKNIAQLMRYEVQPELVSQSNLKWSVPLCLTMPPVAPNVFPVGQAGIIANKEKILIFLQLTRANVDLQPNATMLASLQKELKNQTLHTVQSHFQNGR